MHRIRLTLAVFACSIGMVACEKELPHAEIAAHAEITTMQSEESLKEKGTPEPFEEPIEEPSERILSELLAQQYQQINDAGGMPVTVSATGQEHVLRPRLYDARKKSCQKLSESTGGGYECSMIVMVTLKDDGSIPRESGERLIVHWDAERDEWALGQRKRGKR